MKATELPPLRYWDMQLYELWKNLGEKVRLWIVDMWSVYVQNVIAAFVIKTLWDKNTIFADNKLCVSCNKYYLIN